MSTETTPVVHQVEIVKHGEQLVVPVTMTLHTAVDALQRQIASEEQVIQFVEKFNCYPIEGLLAFKAAMQQHFGTFTLKHTTDMFGRKIPPSEIKVPVGVNKTATVSWGLYALPCDAEADGLLTSVDMGEGRVVFSISGKFKRKWLPTMNEVTRLVHEHLKNHSVYRGSALRLGTGDPEFIDVSKITPDDLVYSRDLTDIIEAYVFAPIRNSQACRDAHIPLKRGVLAAGPYGTGKSLLAYAVAHEATKHGWTFLYVKDAESLPAVMHMARHYQPAVVFCEDIDRQVSGERTEDMDQILNTLDGIDNKGNELIVILTTNHLENINPAMLRPGRLDVILNIQPPDAEACERLVRKYANGLLSKDVPLSEVGSVLAGYTPAIIREVVERAKLFTISRVGTLSSLTEKDILLAAASMKQQQSLLTPAPKDPKTWGDLMLEDIQKTSEQSRVAKQVAEIRERV